MKVIALDPNTDVYGKGDNPQEAYTELLDTVGNIRFDEVEFYELKPLEVKMELYIVPSQFPTD
jgi:hypothetical protein